MKINPNIFKTYDIRGIYPEELNEEVAQKIGERFVAYTKTKEVVIGRDGRLSSLSLFRALSKGIIGQGADVYDLGQIATECLYFAVGKYGYGGGIMITASHNPPEYNGFKMVKKGGEVIRGIDLAEEISKKDLNNKNKKSQIKNLDVWPDYLNHVFSFVDLEKIKPFKVVIDASNGMAAKIISLIEERLPLEISPLNFKIDGVFPGHSPNPLSPGVAEPVGQKVKEENADFGFIFDGDGDRIFLIDEEGNLVSGDVTLLFLAQYFLENNPGEGIAYNLICSRAVPEFIKQWGGKPLKSAVGFVNIKENLIKNGGIMGGEFSGHYSFKDNFYSDSGIIAFLILLQLISEKGEKISEMKKRLSPYAKHPEINIKIEDKEKVLEAVKQKYADGKQDYLDGVTVEYENWWFNIRPSQTEPVLRLTIEAENQNLLEIKKEELCSFLEGQR